MAGKKGQTGRKPKRLRMMPHKYKRDWLHSLDRRSAIYLALNGRLQELQNDLGGEPALSYQQRSLCKRAIWIEAQLMTIEEQVIDDGDYGIVGKYAYLANTLMGIYKTLGIERQARNVGRLKDYIEGTASEHS